MLAKVGRDGDERVAQGVFEHGGLEGNAFSHGGAHEVGREVVHEVVLHEQGHKGKATDGVANEGEDGVVGEIEELAPHGQFVEVAALESAHGKPSEAGGEVDDQQGAEGVAGNGIADEDEGGAGVVEPRAMAHGLEDPERDTDAVDEHGSD